MLDRALAKTFADLSTLILIACVFTVPIHVVHTYVFRDELAIRELAPEIAELPEGRQVRGVPVTDVGLERKWLAAALFLDLAAAALVFRVARRVFAVTEEGGTPTVPDALRHLGSRGTGPPALGPTLALVAIAGVTGWLVLAIGARLADMAPANVAWLGLGVARGVAAGVTLAIAAGGGAALPARSTRSAPVPEKLDLY